MRRKLIALPLMAGALLAGCQSTFKGERLDGDTKATGIPFALVKPQYTLAVTPPTGTAKDPTYALTVNYVPDPSQMYTLRLDPSLFADPDFTMKLSEGTLSGVNAGVTDTAGPTILAIGSFAANVAGALALGTLDVATAQARMNGLMHDPKVAGDPKCKKVIGSIDAQLALYPDDDTFLSTFHPLSDAETACLTVAETVQSSAYQADLSIDKATWDGLVKTYEAKPAHDAAFLRAIKAAVKAGDADAVAKLDDAGDTDKMHLKIAGATEAKDELEGLTANFVKTFTQLSADEWKIRHVGYLDIVIGNERVKEAMDSSGATKPYEARIQKYELQQAQLMGATDLWQRRIRLAQFVTRIRDKGVQGGTAPATAEYTAARTELDAADTAFAAIRAKFSPKAKDSPAAPTGPIQVTYVDIDANPGWNLAPDSSAPDYVLILCAADGSSKQKECHQ